MKKLVAAAASLVLVGTLGACSAPANKAQTAGSSTASSATTQAQDVEMKYTTPADLKKALDDKDDSVVIVDVRKAADYKADHIPGAISADMDKAKGGDMADGKSVMSTALKEATGSENGGDKKLVLVCYSGKSYAQAGTNVLAQLDANMDNVTTLEGGMKAWTKDYADVLEH